ncbi:hypothetical protein OPQ81_005263 [Rhizoctonia solani]|nr:hypothetical protein OPQ81_005263 [Rhizoctonia solani]
MVADSLESFGSHKAIFMIRPTSQVRGRGRLTIGGNQFRSVLAGADREARPNDYEGRLAVFVAGTSEVNELHNGVHLPTWNDEIEAPPACSTPFTDAHASSPRPPDM